VGAAAAATTTTTMMMMMMTTTVDMVTIMLIGSRVAVLDHSRRMTIQWSLCLDATITATSELTNTCVI
jgi:hypothetical protein